MTTSVFPGAADNDTNLIRVLSTDALIPPQHNNLVDAIEAIEHELLMPTGAIAFKPSGVGHAGGLVVDTPAIAGVTRYLREDASWAVPAGGGGGGALSYYHAELATDIVITGANQDNDVVSLSLPAGTYFIIATALFESIGGGNNCRCLLWDGSVSIAEGFTSNAGDGFESLSTLSGFVVLTVTTIYKLTTRVQSNNGLIKASSPYAPVAANATNIRAIKIA